jgi:hypothetical protein
MQDYILFYLVFLSQILLISLYFPRKIYGRMNYIFENYPPSEYPKLYSKPIELYQSGARRYRNLNLFIFFAGLLILAALMSNPHDGDVHNAITMGYFMVQMFPVLLLDLSSLKNLKLMRNADSRTTRRAELHPRRFFDYISLTLFGIAMIPYVAFIVLMAYINQFGFPWFGGYRNVAGITLMNSLFLGLVLWHIYGKKLNPHQSYEDRTTQTKTIAKLLTYTSIAATVFILVDVSLSAFDIRYMLPVSLSIYLQLVAAIGLQAYRIEQVNFEVYKQDPLVS